MRPSYEHAYEFFRDTKNLVESCASLRELYEAMLSVKDSNMREVDASPKRLRSLAETWTQSPVFVPIRLNELFNGLQVEHTDDYVLALVGGLGGRWEEEVRLFMLRHDQQLRDEIFWRVFEVEGGGQISLANVDKFSREDLNWHNTVVLLSNEGTLDRKRVLRSCLEALNRDFSSYRAGWFSRVYEALAPTPAEAAVNQDLLRLCLGSSVTATLSLGVKQLDALHKAGMLEADALVQACGNAFSGPKAAVLILIRMLDALAARKVIPVDDVANVLVLGLSHVHADVQRACIKALKKLGREELAYELRDLVAPAVATELLPLRGVDGAVTEAVQPSAADHAPLQAEPLQPWTDDDALERYAALLEAGDDALEFELAMAWLVTAANAVPVLTPLAKRAAALLKRDVEHFPAALLLSTLSAELEFLAQRFYQRYDYVNGKEVAAGDPVPQPTVEESIVIPSFATRMREVVAMMQGRIPRRVLLATPTDSHGWIDLPTLQARLKALGGNADLLPADRIQAFWRVAPEQRDQALTVLGGERPASTSQLRIEWQRSESDTRKPDGSAQWVFFSPRVQTDT